GLNPLDQQFSFFRISSHCFLFQEPPLHFIRLSLSTSIPSFSHRKLDDTASEFDCCRWADSLCICWISISLLHGVFKKTSYRSDKAASTTGHFSRSLYQHWLPRRWTRPSNLHQEVISFESLLRFPNVSVVLFQCRRRLREFLFFSFMEKQ
uniref:Uncharacterized protein n=1 Tax=Cucumis melo TaxID=3656 RepID=A0A9I9E0T9_CUCME